MYIETNLSKIKQFAAIRKNENIRFRTFLKGEDGKEIDSIVHRMHKEITAQIDCAACANCCCCLVPNLSKADLNMLSGMENISPEEFQAAYCETDYGDIYLKDIPCRYLDGKKCSISENRPEQCQTFPNTNKPGFISRLWSMISYYEICPIVFNLMEMLKKELKFR
ncbi:MAG: YkgJ family cysteine cluster protein [Dysgonamonadaceae bacterium]|jgi:Fe-S-cluster containining protein|nr:YkgJ family cysteine cluster protein [Dysgonamonadaceae bacterium]